MGFLKIAYYSVAVGSALKEVIGLIKGIISSRRNVVDGDFRMLDTLAQNKLEVIEWPRCHILSFVSHFTVSILDLKPVHV